MQTQLTHLLDLAVIFALTVRPTPAPATGRAMAALDQLDSSGVDLFDLDLTPRGDLAGFGPSARDTFRR